MPRRDNEGRDITGLTGLYDSNDWVPVNYYDRLRRENQQLGELLSQSQPWLQEECDELEAEEDNGGADTYDLRIELETLLERIQLALDTPAQQEE